MQSFLVLSRDQAHLCMCLYEHVCVCIPLICLYVCTVQFVMPEL